MTGLDSIQGMRIQLTDRLVSELSDKDILSRVPDDFSESITEEHRAFVWEHYFQEMERLSSIDVQKAYEFHILKGHPIQLFLNGPDSIGPEEEEGTDD